MEAVASGTIEDPYQGWVERREIDRLMLFLPPRQGKSELASKSYPAYTLGRAPWKQIISASASQPLAQDWGRQVRNIIRSDEYQTVFPGTQLAEDSRSAGKWNTKQGGSYISASVGTSILGWGADEYLIDDPFGTMAEAKSQVVRDGVWDWYNGTVYNRLQPGGAIILINHRMHEDDLSGRLIEKMRAGGDKWEIVCLPAIARSDDPGHPEFWMRHDMLGRAPGEALWPALWPVSALERIRLNTPARNWSALYQQNPVPQEGELFSADTLGLRDRTDDVVMWVRGWDLAGTVDGDYTVGVLMGRTRDNRYVVGNVVRLRGRPDKVEEAILETARLDTKRTRISMPRDPGQAGLAQELQLTKLLAGFPVAFSPESGDKETRAEPFAAQVNHGLVTMVRADSNAAYREELRAFPFAKYDDQVDASSRAFMALLEAKMPMRISQEALDRA